MSEQAGEAQVPSSPEATNPGSPVQGHPIPKRTEYPIAWPGVTGVFSLDKTGA